MKVLTFSSVAKRGLPSLTGAARSAQAFALCRRCHKRISAGKLHYHPSSRYCEICEREFALRQLGFRSSPKTLPLAG